MTSTVPTDSEGQAGLPALIRSIDLAAFATRLVDYARAGFHLVVDLVLLLTADLIP